MTITIDRMFTDPTLYFHSFDGDHARFVDLSRDEYRQSIFFDRRIQRGGDAIYRVPVDVLMEASRSAPLPDGPVNFIHHVAQCGSTLLSRALDRSAGALAIREPFALRQLGVEAGAAGGDLGDWQNRLNLALMLLAKRFEPGPVVIKGNVPTTMIAPAIEQIMPKQAGILLYFPLDDYLAAVLRTPQHGEWVRSITDELRIGQNPLVGGVEELSIPQRAAALWALMVRRFDLLLAANPALRSLDANQLFDDPRATIAAGSELFGLGMSDADVMEQVEGGLFTRYAKNPDVPYEPGQRLARREQTMRDYPEAIAEARAWVAERRGEFGLPDSLDRPLVGDSPALL